MGWWKINNKQHGGIDFDFKNEGLVNAIPKIDDSDIQYNGDAPADVFSELSETIIHLWIDEKNNIPCFGDIRQLFDLFFLTSDEKLLKIDDKMLGEDKKFLINVKDLIQQAKKQINDIYIESWNRPPTDFEKESILNFCFSADIQKIVSWKMSENFTKKQITRAMTLKSKRKFQSE